MGFRHWLRAVLGGPLRAAGGPEPPARLLDMVADWANENPRATRGEWASFARGMAREAFMLGYLSGYSSASSVEGLDPDAAADAVDPSWRSSPPVDAAIEHAGAPVLDEVLDDYALTDDVLERAQEPPPEEQDGDD